MCHFTTLGFPLPSFLPSFGSVAETEVQPHHLAEISWQVYGTHRSLLFKTCQMELCFLFCWLWHPLKAWRVPSLAELVHAAGHSVVQFLFWRFCCTLTSPLCHRIIPICIFASSNRGGTAGKPQPWMRHPYVWQVRKNPGQGAVVVDHYLMTTDLSTVFGVAADVFVDCAY